MLTEENRIERIFCPHCGGRAYDCTGEGDWVCADSCKGKWGDFVRPLYERDLQGKELIRLRLENEQLREALRVAMSAKQ